METIHTTALIRTARILRKVLETCCHSNPRGKPSTKTDKKNSQGVNNNNNLFPQLYGFKYFYLILVFFKQIYLTYR